MAEGDSEAALSEDNPTPTGALERAIENGVLLRMALADLKIIKDQQEVNHLVAVQLREHSTIQRVDKLWSTMGEVKFLIRVIAAGGGLTVVIGGILTITHLVVGWP